MYMKIVHSLAAHVMAEGASDFIPDLFDYIVVESEEYQVVERRISFQPVIQGPFKEKNFAQTIIIFVEPKENP